MAAGQLRSTRRHPRSIDVGYPNAFDRAYGRSGSYILIHGGCTSIGCFAMTNPVVEKIYALGSWLCGRARIKSPSISFRSA